MNLTFLKWLEYDYEELVDTNIEASLSIASKMIFHSFFFLQLQLNGKVDEVALTVKTKSGSSIPVILMGYRERISGEEIINCIAIKMTKRYDYEKELRGIKVELEDAYRSKNASLKKESEIRKLLESTLFSIAEGIIVVDLYGKITLMNPMAERLTSWSSLDSYGRDIEDVLQIIYVETKEQVLNPLKEVLGKDFRIESPNGIMLVSKDGSEHFITGTASSIYSDEEEIKGAVIAFRDITKEYLQEKEIDAFLNVNLDMLSVSDLNANFHKVNNKFQEILGYSKEELINKNYLSFIHEEDIESTEEAIKDLANNKKVFEFINRYRCKDGSYKYIEWQSQRGVGNYIYSSARDITEKKRQEEKLRYLSYNDQLTGLHNRQFLNLVIDGEMIASDLRDQKISMAIMDLDHFKIINDTWGHPVGDEFLKLIAETLLKNKRKSDLVFRFGGEEFLILMPRTKLNDSRLFLERMRKTIESLDHPITGRQTISIGVAEKFKEESFFDWYSRADKALYRAKKQGRNQVQASF